MLVFLCFVLPFPITFYCYVSIISHARSADKMMLQRKVTLGKIVYPNNETIERQTDPKANEPNSNEPHAVRNLLVKAELGENNLAKILLSL